MVSFYYNRFATFRKVLDAEMKDATRFGIAQKCQMDSREEITEDEDPQLGTHDLRPTDTPQKTSNFLFDLYAPFDLEELDEPECFEFQFAKRDIRILKEVLHIPEMISCSSTLFMMEKKVSACC